MKSDYWIKLYHEIIDDPKMATLPDRLWRRTIELFLLAGRVDKDGNLPDTRQLAWMLRMSMEDADLDFTQIERTGMIKRTTTGWYVTNFAKRQARVEPAERMRQMRKRKQQSQYYEDTPIDVTDELRSVTQIEDIDRDTDTDKERESFALSAELELYRKVTGLVPDYATGERITQKIQALRSKLKFPPIDQIEALMVDKYSKWRKCRRKDGQLYNPANPDWLDWCITDYSPTPQEVDQKPQGADEAKAQQEVLIAQWKAKQEGKNANHSG